MRRTQQLVEKALTEWPETRDSDRKLIMAVWFLQDRTYQDNFKRFMLDRAIMPETITRMRRKLQEQGKYKASKSVDERRYSKFTEMRGGASMTTDGINSTLL